VADGHDVTVISRNPDVPPNIKTAVILEKHAGLTQIRGTAFDVTLDFICSGSSDVETVFSLVEPGLYVLISTVWLAKLEGNKAEQERLHPVTKKYLAGKKTAEQAVNEKRQLGYQACSVRLPIQSGLSDHTHRLLFYINRIADRQGIILVNGGDNLLQIANNDDIALALTQAVSLNLLAQAEVWDAMPGREVSVKSLIQILASGRDIDFYSISEEELAEVFPEYIEEEPFWREFSLNSLENNLFNATGIIPGTLEDWTKPLWQLQGALTDSPLRKKEMSLIADYLKNHP